MENYPQVVAYASLRVRAANEVVTAFIFISFPYSLGVGRLLWGQIQISPYRPARNAQLRVGAIRGIYVVWGPDSPNFLCRSVHRYTAKLAQKSEQNNLPRSLLFTNLGKMPLKSNRKRFLGCVKNQKKSAEEGVGGEQVRISLPIEAQIPLEILYRGVA